AFQPHIPHFIMSAPGQASQPTSSINAAGCAIILREIEVCSWSQGSSNGVFVAVATKVITPERGGNAELGRWLRSEREYCVSPNPEVSAIGTRAHSSAKRRKPRPP